MDIATFYTFLYILWAVPTALFSSAGRSSTGISQFKVHSLPDSAPLPPSWAGRLPIPDTEEGNALFFWLFEAEDSAYDENLIIWFNGGPGCSSLIGLTTGTGPILFNGTSTQLVRNPHSWTRLGHVLYVDQPAGTGFSTASTPYPVQDQDRATDDFYRWLKSFLTRFSHLRSKRIHLIGESYAGIYIPYLAAAILDNNNSFPIDLRSISLGDATIGNPAAMSAATIAPYLRAQRDLLRMPDKILSAFNQAEHTCGYDKLVHEANHFPPQGKFHVPGNPENLNFRRDGLQQHQEGANYRRGLGTLYNETCDIYPTSKETVLASILNSTCNGPCATFATAINYLNTAAEASANETDPPDTENATCFDIYDINNDCNTIDPLPLQATYFSRPDVQKALNLPAAPTREYSPCNKTILDTLLAEQPTPPAYSLLPRIATKHNLPVHVYSGEYDMLINHIGTELALQNMTWKGAQGFSRPLNSSVFYVDAAAGGPAGSDCGGGGGVSDCEEAGTWVSERGVSYHLFRGAGHTVFAKKPREMFAYVRDVVVAG
ncbi:putative serine carboxypeptidase [Aspergillus campestris IBT 28561]|uniref:Carboxypeptidase n=1 Tax=Aspergillus campestris (strain IBT 28561) TaxID=1392248 RepID=A0A2I1CX30_ASPC2|nr:putative serine carboxypeptidase [Aspergillus campestris IBT 28561]PKY02180.1 putative serine carboxypeptidase [Aspergillus campestris IBT 28561]